VIPVQYCIQAHPPSIQKLTIPKAAANKDALQAAELKAKEKARAHIKFEELNKQIEERKNAKKRKSDVVDEGEENPSVKEDSSSDSNSDSSSESVKEASVATPAPKKNKSRKKRKTQEVSESVPTSAAATSDEKSKQKNKTKKKNKKTKKRDKSKNKGN
jgi:exosome complex protein LRP1